MLITNTQPGFNIVDMPGGGAVWVPNDILIQFPIAPDIATEDLHYLAYIPWDNRFLDLVPTKYRRFFLYVLPYLHARTSDVHTALSVSQLPHLLKETSAPVNVMALYYSMILHDTGWSEVSKEGLVASLSYKTAGPTSSSSQKPKQQHLIYGEALAYKLLDSYEFRSNGPDDATKYYIAEIIRRHDNDAPWENGKYGEISVEMELMCDGDRLWSYTHENFWLDTIRKDVAPETYINTLDKAIGGYFFTEQGKARAKFLIEERRQEVASYLIEKSKTPGYVFLKPMKYYRRIRRQLDRPVTPRRLLHNRVLNRTHF